MQVIGLLMYRRLCGSSVLRISQGSGSGGEGTPVLPDARYTRVAVALHWAIAILLLFNLLTGFFHDVLGAKAVKVVMGIHKPMGLLILALTLVRIAWRVGHRPPPLPAGPAWQRRAASGTHALLYLLMLALPMTGWAMASSTPQPRPLLFFWLFSLPFLPIPKSAWLDKLFGALHLDIAVIALIAIGLHVAGALKHQFVDRDRLLSRMLP